MKLVTQQKKSSLFLHTVQFQQFEDPDSCWCMLGYFGVSIIHLCMRVGQGNKSHLNDICRACTEFDFQEISGGGGAKPNL